MYFMDLYARKSLNQSDQYVEVGIVRSHLQEDLRAYKSTKVHGFRCTPTM